MLTLKLYFCRLGGCILIVTCAVYWALSLPNKMPTDEVVVSFTDVASRDDNKLTVNFVTNSLLKNKLL